MAASTAPSRPGKSTTKISMTMSGSTQGIDLKVAVENTENRTVEALPNK